MKRIFIVMLVLFIFYKPAVVAQTIFLETFGQSTTRTTSPYMPASSFTWADPNPPVSDPAAVQRDKKRIENNYYAVIAPAYIRDAWPVPEWWWWTGPEPIGNTWGGAGNPATNDHTGNTNGAVMVINAGSILNGFYSRNATLEAGSCYRFSAWVYLVNASSSISLQIRDVGTKLILGEYKVTYIGTEDTWQEFSYNFKLPSTCTASSDVEVHLANAQDQYSGNDYYVDDIELAKITCTGTEANITCPTTALLPLTLLNFSAQKKINNEAVVKWETAKESKLSKFEVEKSTNGISFTTVATKTPNNASAKSTYVVIDDLKDETARKIYYRLKITHADGSTTYSKIVVMDTDNITPVVNIYPQPAINGTVDINWNIDKAADVELFDNAGRKIIYKRNYLGKKLTISNLNAGIYFIKISDINKENTITKKIIMN